MTEFETAARGQRASLCQEFVGPALEEMRSSYLARIAEIAATELNPRKRMEAIHALSVGLKVVANITNGLKSAIDAGVLAEKSIVRSEEIERLGRESRRLFDLVPGR